MEIGQLIRGLTYGSKRLSLQFLSHRQHRRIHIQLGRHIHQNLRDKFAALLLLAIELACGHQLGARDHAEPDLFDPENRSGACSYSPTCSDT